MGVPYDPVVEQARTLRFFADFGSLPLPARRFLCRAAERRFRRDPKAFLWKPTLAQAHRVTDAELLSERGCGPVALATIRQWLALHPAFPSAPPRDWLAEE